MAPLSSLGLFAKRVTSSVVGRPLELASIERELTPDRTSLVCLTLEGEPGIGKTRMLLAIEELARAHGFAPIAVTADEEIRGPFLVARSIFGSPVVLEAAAAGGPAQQAVANICDALSNMDDPGLDRMAPDQKLVRLFDLSAVGLRALAAQQPLALLIDDVQWADEDSLRMLRYVIRTVTGSPIVLVLASRADEMAFAQEAVSLVADAERMGLLRRHKLGRFNQTESAEFLQQLLGAKINPSSAAAMHAQAEGVPFILAEQVSAYRDAGMIQQIDGTWTLGRSAERLLPSAVRTLIQRRSAHLPEDTKTTLAEAAVLGRTFSLRDLRDIKVRLSDETREVHWLADALAPAVDAGLLIQYPADSPADYSFYHDGAREFAASTLTPPRQRAIHEAIVHMMTASGSAPAESMALVARHALAAGLSDQSANAAVEAGRNALEAHAPEECLRLVELAQPIAATPSLRIALLRLQDDALEMLRRPAQRLEGLAQLSALVEAMGDQELETEVMLRRAAALRLSREYDRAADIARQTRDLAVEREDRKSEMMACLELGQDLLQAEIGESYVPVSDEVDLDGATDAFKCVVEAATELEDDAKLAAGLREIGVINIGHVRKFSADLVDAGQHHDIIRRTAAGEQLSDIIQEYKEVLPALGGAVGHLKQALEVYERIGDRQGAMSTIIAMAYISWAPDIHFAGGAKRIEEIRSLTTRMKSFTRESDRAAADAQMLYGSHVYARAKTFPDVALTKGEEAFRAAQELGDRMLQFSCAGGVAMVCADLGDTEEAGAWLDRAAEVASQAPSATRAILMESWRGRVSSVAGDAAGMRQHLERAVQLATDQGRAPARCEALAHLALEAAALGAQGADEELLALAESSAQDAKGLASTLAGRPPWGLQADAALAKVALARGDTEAAAQFGREALTALDEAQREDSFFDIQLPAAEALIAGGTEEEAAAVRDRLGLALAPIIAGVLDEDIRLRWLQGPVGRDLSRLAGPQVAADQMTKSTQQAGVPLSEADKGLLQLLTEGRSNAEIAAERGTTEETVLMELSELYVKIGASSRADATTAALIGKLV